MVEFDGREAETVGGGVSRRRFMALPSAGGVGPLLRQETGLGAWDSAGKIPYRTLGRTGLKVAPVGFGAMRTKDPSVLLRVIRDICRFCSRCEATCPRGVPVQDASRAVMYAEGYGDIGLAREACEELRFSLQSCLDCTTCVAHCAHGLDLPGRVQKVRRWLAGGISWSEA